MGLVHAQFPAVTSDEVKKSLEQNAKNWQSRIEALGRPRLLMDKAALAEVKARLMTEPRSPAVKAMLARAYEVAAKPVPTYRSPEEVSKAQGKSLLDANQELWQRDVGDNIVLLTVAAVLDPSPVLQKALHDIVVEACRYPTWGRGNQTMTNMDLACAHVARGIALAWDWYPGLWSEADRELIIKTITERTGQLLKGLYGQGFWARSYTDNHNHVDCAALGWCGIAFYSEIPQAPEWLAAARLNFQNVARYFPEDGSSAEGVPYWSYGVSYILQYIEGTRGVIDSEDLYQAAFLKNATAYRLNASTSGLGGTLPWGDAQSRDYYGPQHILNRLALEYKNPAAGWLSQHLPWLPVGPNDILVWMALWQVETQKMPALPLDYHHWLNDIVVTRSGWGPGDYLLAIKSGYTNRNHSHLDAGALAFAFDDEWLLTAPGYGRGSGSLEYWLRDGKRWTFFANATESHCTLLINGKNQRFDLDARGTIDAYLSTPFWSWTGINLTEAYADVHSVRREVLHRRGDYILVFDAVAPKQSATVEWLAQLPQEPEFAQNAFIAEASSGQLRVEMLSPRAPFVTRQPLSQNVDIPKVNIHTFSVKQTGESASFVALLQPGFSSETLPPLKVTAPDPKNGVTHLVLQGDDWEDHIYKSNATEPLPIGIKSGAVKITAKVAAIRLRNQEIQSCLAIQATSVELPGIAIQLEGATQIGIQKTPNGSWIIDADRDISGRIKASEYALQAFGKNQNAFRYLLLKSGTTPTQASDWLSSLLLFREKSPLVIRELSPQPPLSAAAKITIEAESFDSQRLGKAEVVEGRPGAIGKSVRGFGNGASEHVMAWKFEVAQAGQYQLMLRYATKLPDVSVAILIDGAAPSQGLTKVALPTTGGWSIKEDNWKEVPIEDGKGQPFVFHLSKGIHVIKLARPSGAASLDRLVFQGTGKK